MDMTGPNMAFREYEDRLSALREELVMVTAERDKLKEFKEYVHARLDKAGVPTDPESPHKAEGCRIGGRFDIVLTRYMALEMCLTGGFLTQAKFREAMAYVEKHHTLPDEQPVKDGGS